MTLDHDQPPQVADGLDPESLRRIKTQEESPYFHYVLRLRQQVVGKHVMASEAGTSGFILYFDDGTWAISYLSEGQMKWEVGRDGPDEAVRARMNSPEYGDASQPLEQDLPYAHEPCDFVAEVAKAEGKRVTGLAIGEDTFNFCFPDGRELDVSLRQDSTGTLAHRVYWEQW